MEDPNEARKRRLEANYWISQGDPGRFSPQTNAGLRQFHDMAVGSNAALDRQRAAELEMLRQQGFNAIGVEKERANGLINQGVGAAKIKGDTDVTVARIGAESAKAKWGWFDDQNVYHPGSEATVAENNNRTQLEQSRLERDARIEAARIGGDWHRYSADVNALSRENSSKNLADAKVKSSENVAGATRDSAVIRAGAAEQAKRAAIVQDVMQGKYMMSGMTPEKWKQMTPEQQQAWLGSLK